MWENNVLGFVPNKDWLDVGINNAFVRRPNDPADVLFSDDKTDNIMAEWESIKSAYQTPVMAQFHSFDTESQKTMRVPIDTHNIEKGLIKVKINQSERMRALLRTGVRDSDLYRYVMDDGLRLADQVVTRTKVAKNEVLATGKMTIKENDLDLTVDYGVPDDQLSLTLDFSADAQTDVPSQIQAIIDKATEKGVTLTGIYTSKVNITRMRQNADIQKAINGNVSEGTLVRRQALEAYLEDEFGITQVITNDLTYSAPYEMGEDGRPIVTAERYFPKNKVTFFSTSVAGRLGTGLWGDAPEADVRQFMATGTEAPYVTISQWTENDPAVLWTKASGLFIPVLFNPNSLFIAGVTTGETTTGGEDTGA